MPPLLPTRFAVGSMGTSTPTHRTRRGGHWPSASLPLVPKGRWRTIVRRRGSEFAVTAGLQPHSQPSAASSPSQGRLWCAKRHCNGRKKRRPAGRRFAIDKLSLLAQAASHEHAHHRGHHETPGPAAGVAQAVETVDVGVEVGVHLHAVGVELELRGVEERLV